MTLSVSKYSVLYSGCNLENYKYKLDNNILNTNTECRDGGMSILSDGKLQNMFNISQKMYFALRCMVCSGIWFREKTMPIHLTHSSKDQFSHICAWRVKGNLWGCGLRFVFWHVQVQFWSTMLSEILNLYNYFT